MTMKEEMKKAFDFAADLTKLLVTVASGLIALAITFSKDFVHPPASALPYAYWSWYLFLVSIGFGIGTLATLTGNLAKKPDPTPYAWNTTLLSILQFLTFGAGLILTVAFGVKSI